MVKKPSDLPVDLNTCSEQELANLDGLGPRTAEVLIDSRRVLGPFRDLEDIRHRKLRSVGSAKLRALATGQIYFGKTDWVGQSISPAESSQAAGAAQIPSSNTEVSGPKKLLQIVKKALRRTSSSASTDCSRPQPAPLQLPGTKPLKSAAQLGPLEEGLSPAQTQAFHPARSSPSNELTKPRPPAGHVPAASTKRMQNDHPPTEAHHQNVVASTAMQPWWHDSPDAAFPAEFQVTSLRY